MSVLRGTVRKGEERVARDVTIPLEATGTNTRPVPSGARRVMVNTRPGAAATLVVGGTHQVRTDTLLTDAGVTAVTPGATLRLATGPRALPQAEAPRVLPEGSGS